MVLGFRKVNHILVAVGVQSHIIPGALKYNHDFGLPHRCNTRTRFISSASVELNAFINKFKFVALTTIKGTLTKCLKSKLSMHS
jgi:hypothetical protein